MQRFILSHKNQISFISGSLLIIAFIIQFTLKETMLFDYLLIMASIIAFMPIVIQAYQALRYKVISIDVLVTIAISGAFMIGEFEESAIVSFLFLFGAFLEARTLNRTRSAIKSLIEMAPLSALKKMGEDEYEEVEIDCVEIDDILLVKTGARIPVDGYVIAGEGFVDESSITGESYPVHKKLNAKVYAGTILENGTIHIKTKRIGEDTTFGKIIELVEEAQDSKSSTERFIDRFSKYYTPIVLLLAFIVYLFSFNIELAITILVLGCPGALVIGVPVSNVAGIGNGASNGILLKGSEIIQSFSKANVFVFDKTGTLTIGKPMVSVFKNIEGDETFNRSYLYSIEKESDHPLAHAITQFLQDSHFMSIAQTKVLKGEGISAIINQDKVIVGSVELMLNHKIEMSEAILLKIKELEDSSHSIVCMAINHRLACLIGIKDQLRPNVKTYLEQLRKEGAHQLILCSGDNEGSVQAIAKELDLDEAYARMLPEDKAELIQRLKHKGHHVVFVGDGINDSPSIALADIGIAMGNGTDVAIETSDVVLMDDKFKSLVHAYRLSKVVNRNMKQNIVIAVGVVLFLLASVFLSEWMNMSIGMFVHEGSILVVILNGMRLLKFKTR